MPEYLAPGVYYEEVSYRTKSISGVSTTTTGFVGPARYGPLDLEPELVTSLEEFERTYGDGQPLKWEDDAGNAVESPNYLWHAVRGFFLEGGRRLYISRVFRSINAETDTEPPDTGRAAATVGTLTVEARFPGEAGNMRVRFTFRVGQNILVADVANGLLPNDLVILTRRTPDTVDFRWAERTTTAVGDEWVLTNGTPADNVALTSLNPTPVEDASDLDLIQIVTVMVTVIDTSGREIATFGNIPLAPNHVRNGEPDGLNSFFAADQPNPSRAASLPIIINYGADLDTPLDVFTAFTTEFATDLKDLRDDLIKNKNTSDTERSRTILLADGNDGKRPGAVEYEGTVSVTDAKTGLRQFEDIEDISIVAAPGASAGYADTTNQALQTGILATTNALLTHARNMRFRIAILDSSNNESVAGVRRMRAQLSSLYGALYYPWITIQDPITRRPINVPPSGFIAGIYARNDNTRGVFKAPANETVTGGVVGLEKTINRAQQEVLNPEGINVTRFFEGRGRRVWGARCTTDDTEWMYVNVRRYFNYIGRSLDLGTQWAVFEPNDHRLWDKVTRAITTFLRAEWRSGALLGTSPEQAFFVRCDRSTMSQYDLDQGRLICLVGIAPVKPAEFVILRVGQWTADAS